MKYVKPNKILYQGAAQWKGLYKIIQGFCFWQFSFLKPKSLYLIKVITKRGSYIETIKVYNYSTKELIGQMTCREQCHSVYWNLGY